MKLSSIIHDPSTLALFRYCAENAKKKPEAEGGTIFIEEPEALATRIRGFKKSPCQMINR